jgi:MYXO-CTERM domain-containing protein
MTRSPSLALVRAGVFALSVLLLPLTTPTFAQTTNPTPEAQRVDTRADRTGLWGLLGLAGLAGLLGRRRPDTVHTATDTHARSRT